MKTLTASLFALVLSAPFALADGCGMHVEQEASMSCATGQAWTQKRNSVSTQARKIIYAEPMRPTFCGAFLLGGCF